MLHFKSVSEKISNLSKNTHFYTKNNKKSHKNPQTCSIRIATGSRITLTSPDPSANTNTQPDTEHENTIFSESDAVTFIAQQKKSLSMNGADDESFVSISSDLLETITDESTVNKEHKEQRIEVIIDSMPAYTSDRESDSSEENSNKKEKNMSHDESENLIREEKVDEHERIIKNDEL